MGDVPKFSKAADNNKDHILAQLRKCLKSGDRVLEIASGTAQHALYFSEQLPHVFWQPSDLDIETYGLSEVIGANSRDNLGTPFNLDVAAWPEMSEQYDAVYSANCIHIIEWEKVGNYVQEAAQSLRAGGALLFYGPFKYNGEFTTPSNQQFNGFLEQTYPGGGIRDFEALNELARTEGLSFESDTPMPANNQFLIWRK